MKISQTQLTWVALVLGLNNLLLRRNWWAAAYDESAQLVTNGGLLRTFALLVAVCAAVVVVVWLLLWRRKVPAGAPYGDGGRGKTALRAAAGLCALAGGICEPVQNTAEVAASPIAQAMSLFLILQGIVMLYLALARNRESGGFQTALLLPFFTSCFWLVAFYHQYGSAPSTETYLWPMIAGILVSFAWMYDTAFVYQPQRGKWVGPLALLVLLTVPPALAAPLSLDDRLALVSALLWFLAASLELKPVPEALPTPAAKTNETGEENPPCPN
ncbi:MAG: hypothetical protein LIO45_07240 [Clostridiales bacterium]|nr:hypothetical protein [Clostridiales bacterium]